jgi:hypothetical protein
MNSGAASLMALASKSLRVSKKYKAGQVPAFFLLPPRCYSKQLQLVMLNYFVKGEAGANRRF